MVGEGGEKIWGGFGKMCEAERFVQSEAKGRNGAGGGQAGCGRHNSTYKLTPIIQRHAAFEFEVLSAKEVTLLVELIED